MGLSYWVVCARTPAGRRLTREEAAVHQEEDWYVARCLELEIASQGETLDEAQVNLGEAVELYLDEASQPTIESTPLATSFQVGRAA